MWPLEIGIVESLAGRDLRDHLSEDEWSYRSNLVGYCSVISVIRKSIFNKCINPVALR